MLVLSGCWYTGMRLCPLASTCFMVVRFSLDSVLSMNALFKGVMDLTVGNGENSGVASRAAGTSSENSLILMLLLIYGEDA